MTEYVTSADGTRIAYDRSGKGKTVILVGGLFCERQALRALAERMGRELSVINYDRRGRGESGDTPPYAVAREVEDLSALLEATGGAAAVYGHSSGAGLALNAAAHGLPISRLVLHEPPYGSDDDESRRSARTLAEGVRDALARGRASDAIELFFTAYGLPPETVAELGKDPKYRALAHTMIYDFEIMGEFSGGGIPLRSARAIGIPTLVIAGGASPDFFRETAARLAEIIPNGRLAVLEEHGHDAPPDAVVPVVSEFLSAEVAHQS